MTEHPRQLPLDLPNEPYFGRDDFLAAASNHTALDLIDRWPEWPDRVLVLTGAAGSGKSHLGAIWATQAHARILPANGLGAANLEELAADALLIEDADRQRDEVQLFHLLNLVRPLGGWLVLTGRTAPDQWDIRLPDLLSRLRLAPLVELSSPDDGLVRAVLVKLFHDRQLMVEAHVVEFIALRIERSLAAARSVVAALDREALALSRRISRRIAGDVLKRIEDQS